MRNKAAQKFWKEADQDFLAEKPAIASSSEVPGNHHHLGPKRQRRPSVRLEDIGDRPAAVPAEKKRKKIVFITSPGDACPGKRTSKLDAGELLENTSKVLKVRSLVNVNNGDTHGRDSSHADSDLVGQTVRNSELESPCSSTPVEGWQQEPQTVFCDVTKGPKSAIFLKPVSKKGRNGIRRRGGLKSAASVKQFASSRLLVITSEREPHIKEAINVHSEEENEPRTPEGFRDCDLEASDYYNDAKDLSNSLESKPLTNGDVPTGGEQECQFRGAYENGVLRQDHDRAQRDEPMVTSQQVSQKSLPNLNEETINRSKERGVSPGLLTKTALKSQTYVVDAQSLKEANRVPHASKAKSNEQQESREPPGNKTDLHFAKRQPPLLNGVRGWLQNLGLGKYLQHFEAHEVDIEVLPLLTFDDLKEMGITAVGSRRKLFFAIQQLGNCSVVKAD
ncbi:hypothetical protein L7F22_051021 [Adiantum nelumboides]|nr:hypothetical protein [Adiantum nelumboides]